MHARIGGWCAVTLLGAAMFACSLGGRQIAVAQDSAPAGVIPEAALCQAEPRTVDELVALFAAATPAATDAPDSVEIPTGQTASSVLADGITATVHEAFACLNGGDWLRFLGLLTDDAILMAFPWLGDELAMGVVPNELTTPAPLTEEYRQTVVAVADVRTVGNDRAGAFVVYLDPSSGSPGPHAMHLVLVRSGDDWLIDAVVDFSDE